MAVELHKVVACNCLDCQVFGGGPFRNNGILNSKNIPTQGKISNYNKIGGSGAVLRQAFCGIRGTHFYAFDTERTVSSVHTGFLDQHSSLAPFKHIFGKSALKWLSSMSEFAWFEKGLNSGKIHSLVGNLLFSCLTLLWALWSS